ESGDLVGAEHGGQGSDLLAVGDHTDDVLAAQGDGVEEAQGTDGLVEASPGGLLSQQVKLILSDGARAEWVRGRVEVQSEAGDGGDVDRDGAGGVVAQLKVLAEALTQGRHGKAPGGQHPRSVGGSWPGGCQPSLPRARAIAPPRCLPPTAQRFSST